ncbi:DHC8 protein [Gonium pectorale]|uniref:DHC8 protein n=1 Tax=Gonium pectorale TaxID=33097 RepID=A0A150H0U9_GONPE|nr:DHC8 protein [Gonium pectorale]|eukprot:KXZ55711.1 DHC8 protein [Gonium pectorale]
MPPSGEKNRGLFEPPVPESPVWLPSIAQGRGSSRGGSPGAGFTLPKTRNIPVPTTLKSNAELFTIGTLPNMANLDIGTRRRKSAVPKLPSIDKRNSDKPPEGQIHDQSESFEDELTEPAEEDETLDGPRVDERDAAYDPDLIPGINTGEDVVEFYGKFGQDSAVKFFYCNRAPDGMRFRPYDLLVVRRQKIGPEYFTVSATGVMRIKRGVQAEFTPLAEWVREKTLFDLISAIGFFRNYLTGRCFRRWLKAVRQKNFNKVKAKIQESLFLAKGTFCPHLLEIYAAIDEVRSTPFASANNSHLYALQEYAELQVNAREHKAKPALEAIVEKVQKVLERVCREVQKQAKLYQQSVRDQAELEDTTGVELLQGRNAGCARPMITIKREKIERAQNFARVMREVTMLGSFIRLADYLFVEGVISRVLTTTEEVLGLLTAPKTSADKQSKGVFQTTIGFIPEGITFTPDDSAMLEELNNTIEGIIGLAQQAPRLIFMRAFAQYFDGKPSGLNPGSVIRSSPNFNTLRNSISSSIQEDFAAAREYVKIFEAYRMVYDFGRSWSYEAYSSRPKSLREIRRDMHKQREWRNELDRMKIFNVVGCLYVDSKSLRNDLMPITLTTLERIKGLLLTMARDTCLSVLEDVNTRISLLQARPTALDEFMAYQVMHAKQVESKKAVLAAAAQVDDMYDMLAAYEQKVPTTDAVKHDDLREAAGTFVTELTTGKEFMADHKVTQMESLAANIARTHEELAGIMASLNKGDYINPDADAEGVLADLEAVLSQLRDLSTACDTYKEYQTLFELEPDAFTDLTAVEKEANAKYQLWKSLYDFMEKSHNWTEDPILDEAGQSQMSIEAIRAEVEEYAQRAYKMGKAAKEDQVVVRLKDCIDDFKQILPLVEELANPALKTRHWEQIFKLIDADIPPNDNGVGYAPFSVRMLLQYNALDRYEPISAISGVASKEYSLEKVLEKMDKDWRGVEFHCIEYKDTGTYILGGTDEIQALLDDQIVKTQAMRASPYIKPLEAHSTKWEAMLTTLQDMLDNWLTCQATWQYLEPIFSSPDILKQMPEEGEKFQLVDQSWREVMESTAASPACVIVAEDREKLLALQEANRLLEEIQKGLAAYLELKRLAFPRFFFLSNDEMLEILSETKDPTRVQPHLKKCFEGIDKLRFEGPATEITGMISCESEIVPLKTKIRPAEANGSVEKWLVQVEAGMMESVQEMCRRGVLSYPTVPREQWVLEWPGQVVLVVSAIYWTRDVVAAITSPSATALTECAERNTAQLGKIVSLVRGELSKLNRATLSALVVMDVHARDVVVNLAKEEGVKGDPNHFSWLSQLRMYWEAKAPQQAEADEGTIMVRMMNAEVEYGYEYLGNSMRLVVTPLTDRCYRTLISAIHLNLGGAPEGPAGTGKTETTKDLAKALARQCVVFNCSDTLDYTTMAKFFKGLASSGAWACFDEFNRIDLEVLSVVAQQVLEIQLAVKQRVKTFFFEGTELSLRPTCNVFITMNPGYAGRSELPDNLKALFRTVAMMVPDYAMISEIMLYSNGYLQARECARKIVATYKLCSEQLSSQDHYDYGMRAVMAVLRAAGNLKRRFPDTDEYVLMLRSIIDVNLCKFLSHDVPLFNGIVSDLFPDVVLPEPDYAHLMEAMKRQCAAHNLQPTPYFLMKTIQLYEMVVVRHGLMTVGQPFSGKTASLKVLAGALTDLHERGIPGALYNRVQLRTINPKSVTMGQLYGETDRATQEWKDGVLAVAFRSLAADQSEDRKWLVLDGPVDAIWIENMNTVLDDNKKLCLPNSEIIQMSATMSMIFEVGDLAVASPATVSRCGMVYLEPHQLGWNPLLISWLATVPRCLGPKVRKHIENLFEWLMPACLRFVRKEAKEISPTEDIGLARSTMRLMSSLLADDFGPSLNATAAAAAEKADKAAVAASEAEKVASAAALQTNGSNTAGNSASGEKSNAEEDAPAPDRPPTERGEEQDDAPPGGSYDDNMKIVLVEAAFLFALVWSVGCTGDGESRRKFDAFLRSMLSGIVPDGYLDYVNPSSKVHMSIPPPPPDGGATVFDYALQKRSSGRGMVPGSWQLWTDTIPELSIPNEAQFADIIIPTKDSARYTFLLDTALQNNQPLLMVGPTGTGKSTYINRHLVSVLPRDKWTPIFVTFSARTTANMAQEQIDGRLDKRRKGVYGPPMGRRAVLFVDDLNMPAKETYGAQPPIELLRQALDQGGWYGRDNAFRTLVDVQLVAAMGPPGGGRTFVTNRFLRHFNVLALAQVSDDSLVHIFRTILDWHLTKGAFPLAVQELSGPIINATLEVYSQSMAKLLPTPTKSHYVFNLRDFARVVQGVMMLPRASLPQPTDPLDETVALSQGASLYRRLWVHEVFRVFYDRLVDDVDREWLMSQVKTTVAAHLGSGFDLVMEGLLSDADKKAARPITHEDMRRCFFGDYADSNEPDPTLRKYAEVADVSVLVTTMEEYLMDHNGTSKRPMNLAMFLFAVEHVSRICRLLKQPGGNMLLVGVGGSGRQSLTRLAGFICGMEVLQVEIAKSYGRAEWRAELKQVVFLFSDTQIKDESFLEDINNILNSGEVPNMFPQDERMTIMEAVRPRAAKRGLETPLELWGFFVETCRRNLHVVLCFSPIGDAFRERLRANPSIVNCCTIDWFQTWPRDALEAVAYKFLKEMELDDNTRTQLVHLCQAFHGRIREASDHFRSQLGRHNYVTPTSYLELINTFRTLLDQKRAANRKAHSRYTVGLQKLENSAEQVAGMQAELQALQPQLVRTVAEVESLMAVIAREKAEVVEPKAAIVKGEEAKAQSKADAAKAIKDECEADLAEALPILNEALAALDTIDEKDINYIKKLGNPPSIIKLVLEAVCVILDVRPAKVKDDTGKMMLDYWKPSVALMNEKDFLQRLKLYDKDNIPPRIIGEIRERFIKNDAFTPAAARNASPAAEGMCKWVHAMSSYDKVAKVVAPKKAKLMDAEAQYEEVMVGLRAKQQELADLRAKLAAMESDLRTNTKKKERLEQEVALCSIKLERAEKLIGGLGGEKVRWTEAAQALKDASVALTGDMLVAAGIIAYCGAFTASFRQTIIEGFLDMVKAAGIPHTHRFSLAGALGDPVRTREWLIAGLPNDSFSIENGIIVAHARRWPLMIDPQGQANKWVKNLEKERKLQVIKLSEGSDFLRVLENAIQFGLPVLLENVGEELDPSLEPLLLKQTFKSMGVTCIRLGDATIEYSADFRFYITTKLRNPHYLPEVAVKVTLLNFMITPAGLADQLLGVAVTTERPDLEEKKAQLVLQGAENTRRLAEIEDRILEVLSNSTGNILEDETAITIITEAKTLGNEIQDKQRAAEVTERAIDVARTGYKPCGEYTSILFFCISDLAAIDPMYQYSLPWFVNLFVASMHAAEPSNVLERRLENIYDHFTYALYRNVCRSLFEKDKLLFAFLLCTRILETKGRVDIDEYMFLLTGGLGGAADPRHNPASDWLVERGWRELCRLDRLPTFMGLADAFTADPDAWRPLYDAAEPHRTTLPGLYNSLDSFRKLLIVRCVRPDKVVPAVQDFVEANLGKKYVEPPPFDLAACYADSAPTTPLIFVLSPGSDPTAALLQFAGERNMGSRLMAISLGQGQGPKAAAMIAEGARLGSWVVLQNCHLAPSWMPTLDKICEELQPDMTHNEFRLWMTSYPSPKFPVNILQNGVKMTNEPPKGIKANMRRSYMIEPICQDKEFFETCVQPGPFKKLLFGLVFFHALVQERRKFGPLGWNIPYGFDDGDQRISVRQLKMFLDEAPQGAPPPFAALRYVTGECNYGGRVTDDKDRLLLNTILERCYCPEIITDEEYKLSASGLYYAPSEGNRASYLTYIDSLPIIPLPEAFGLHENADIAKDQNDTAAMFASLLAMTGGGGSGGGGSGGGGAGGTAAEDRVAMVVVECLARLPPEFDIEAIQRRWPVKYEESLNTVLSQECSRFNKLLAILHESLVNIRLALQGLLVMSAELEAAVSAIAINQVPELWKRRSYPSLKPLGSYLEDLYQRLDMFGSWAAGGPPPSFWLPGFFFVQSFLTASLQNYARRRRVPIDTVSFGFETLGMDASSYRQPPTEGVYVHGMFLEGCGWDAAAQRLCESQPKVLFVPAPVMWLRPRSAEQQEHYDFYDCPLYRTADRRGVLATTGHSTNFVMFVKLPTDMPASHWIMRGVALLTQLSD